MKLANFKFNLLGCKSFVFQHVYSKPYITYDKTLTITFPTGEVLKFSEADENFNTQLPSSGSNGDFTSEILADLNEWGYDLSQGTAVIMADIDTIKEDLLLHPDLFTKDGAEVAFTYDTFPDGVYHVEFSFKEKPATYSEKTLRIDSGGGTPEQEPYYGEKYILSMCNSLSCRAAKIDEYFKQGCNTPADCHKQDTIAGVVTRMRLLELGALWDFSQKDYENTTKKVQAMSMLCTTGNCNYKTGC